MDGLTETVRQPLRLVKFTFAQFGWMQRHGHDKIPFRLGELGSGALSQQLTEERLEPQCPLVLIFVNNIEHCVACDHGGAGMGKCPILGFAVRAFKGLGDGALKRQTAPFAKGLLNKLDRASAALAKIAVPAARSAFSAHLANLGIIKAPAPTEKLTDRLND